MRLYQLGHVPWQQSQAIYHALAHMGRPALVLLSPAESYVSTGFHQDATQEVDLDYCRQAGIPVFRREVGGGAVFLDGRQLFYQLILAGDDPLAATDKLTFYRRLLGPVVETYRDLGVDAQFKPVNDIITAAGRKISGNGAAHIGPSVVLVGNLILDFDYDTMARVLRVPDEKYRDKVHKSLQENLTTLRRELGAAPAEDEAYAMLVRRFAEVLGPLEPAALPDDVVAEADRLAGVMYTDEWLHGIRRPVRDGRTVRVASGVDVVQRLRKTAGGLVRATLEVRDGTVLGASISGDFFFYPEEKLADLAAELEGVPLAGVQGTIEGFYQKHGVDSPGLAPAELASILQGTP